MPTTCTFHTTTFQGIVTAAPEGEFDSEVDRSGISGAHGLDEIKMGRRGVPIEVDIWLFGFADDSAIQSYISSLIPLIQQNGVLQFAGGITRVYSFVTLDKFRPIDKATTQTQDPAIMRCQTWRFSFTCLRPV